MSWVVKKGFQDPSVLDGLGRHINVVDFGVLTDRRQFHLQNNKDQDDLSFYKKDADIDELIKLNLKHIN